jgi:hypothetical protein
MTTHAEELSVLGLSRDELRKLPAALRKKIAAALGPKETLSGDWLLVGARDERLVPVVTRAMAALPRIASARQAEISERNIESLVDILLSDTPRAKVDADLELDNAELRAAYIKQTATLTGAQVRAASGLSPKNKSEPASRWKREGKVFAVRRGGIDIYPAFQFADGAPLPALKAVLAALPGALTPWQTALWFASGNGWLDGAAPQERLATPDEVIAAARQLATPAAG